MKNALAAERISAFSATKSRWFTTGLAPNFLAIFIFVSVI
jgi:hypothetical protein